MKKIFIFILSIFVLCFSSYAKDKLEEIDAMVTFPDTDLSAEYKIEQRQAGGSVSNTTAVMFRRDSTDQFLILILEPIADKGKGYLKQGDNLWLYDPVGKSFTFTSAKERFQNSGFRNSDFTKSEYAKNYRIVESKKEKLGKFNCDVYSLEAKNNEVTFPKSKIWVSSDDGLIRKVEDYSLSGQKMRITAIPSYQKVGDRWVPLAMTMEDQLKFKEVNGKKVYERTTVKISKPSLKKLADSTYTKEYLEKVSK